MPLLSPSWFITATPSATLHLCMVSSFVAYNAHKQVRSPPQLLCMGAEGGITSGQMVQSSCQEEPGMSKWGLPQLVTTHRTADSDRPAV